MKRNTTWYDSEINCARLQRVLGQEPEIEQQRYQKHASLISLGCASTSGLRLHGNVLDWALKPSKIILITVLHQLVSKNIVDHPRGTAHVIQRITQLLQLFGRYLARNRLISKQNIKQRLRRLD
jgi:hypothetical protein